MQVNLDLSTAALRKLLRGQTVQLKHEQINKGSPVYIPEYYHAISKAYSAGRGVRISLSKESQDENIHRHAHIRNLLPKKRVAELVREEEEEYDGDVDIEGGKLPTARGVGRQIRRGFEDFGKKLNTARVPLARVAAAILPTVADAVEKRTGLPAKSLTKGLEPLINKGIDRMERQQKRNTAKRKAAKEEMLSAPEPIVAVPTTADATGDPTQDPAMQISGGRIRAIPHNAVNKPVLFYQPVKEWRRGGALYPPDR